MFKVGTNIIGIGNTGISAINGASKCEFTGARFITVSGNVTDSKAEFVYETKNEFMSNAQKHYMSQTSTSIVIADCANSTEAALACEICAISTMMKALTIAFVHLPDSMDEQYNFAKEYVEELHEVCNSVVIINDGYTDDFKKEFVNFLMAVSCACDVNSEKRIASYEELCQLFTQKNDMYFVSCASKYMTDSHKYKSQCLSLKLESQVHIDVANNWIYIISCNGEMQKSIVGEYINAIDKKNLACLPAKKLCISQNDKFVEQNGFLFAVLCAQ